MLQSPLIRDLVDTTIRFIRHDGPMVAGHLAYLSVLGIFPFLIILVALTGLFGNTPTGAQAILLILETLPPDIMLVIEQPVAQIVATSQGGALTLGLLGALWVSASAIGAARQAIDRAFEASHAPAFWLRHLQSIGLVILAALALAIGFSVFVLGPIIWESVLFFLPTLDDWTLVANLVRYGSSLVLLYFALSVIFFALRPRHQGRYAPVARGALLTLFLWVIIGAGFSTYLKNFANYNITYGSLAGAIATLVFFYLLCLAFLIGAELNAVTACRRQNTTKRVATD